MSFNVSIIYDYFTPAFRAGGPTQSLYNLVTSLRNAIAEAGGALKVICTDEDLGGVKLHVPADEWTALSTGPNTCVEVWYASANGEGRIERLINQNDVLFINSIFSHHFNYASLIKSRARRKIISPRGMLDPGSLSQKPWKKQIYLAYLKLKGIDRLCEWHATTEQEKHNIQKVFGTKAKVWVVPNFPRVIEFQPTHKETGRLALVTIALVSPMKNHLLILQALHRVTSEVSWDIYGPIKDQAYWKACEQLIKNLPGNITVTYHGDVPPLSVPAALAKGQVAILPSKSENFGHSIYEAFTAGKPVITSMNTPWNELKGKKAGINVGIANEESLKEAIEVFANMQDSEFQVWAKSARELAIKAVDIESIKQGYLAMFEG